MATGLDPPPPYAPPPYPGLESLRDEDSGKFNSCPNGCKTGVLSHGELKKHLLDCPLQPVECEFAHAGCDIKVLRRDLAKHMTENAQHHVMSATLLNLRLTRELHQKIEQKDQQIANLQQQIANLQQQVKHLSQSVGGFVCHDLILTNFKEHQKKGGRGEWYSNPIADGIGGFKVQLQIDTNGRKGKGTHLTAWLNHIDSRFGPHLSEYAKVFVSLHMLNRLGDYGHHVVIEYTSFRSIKSMRIGNDDKYFPVADLGYNPTYRTEYLRNDSLHFKLYLKSEIQINH